MPRRRVMIFLLGTALAGCLLAAAGCTGGSDQPAERLPPGDELVRSAAEAMRAVDTARFDLAADGTLAGVPLRRADGVLTRQGEAEGTAQIDQSGPLAELSFVVKGQTLHVKGATGGWQRVPLALASSVYDPSKILDPDQGVAHVLATATGPRTEARERVQETDAYRVAVTVTGEAVSKLVPGVSGDVPGQLWIGVEPRVLHQARFTVPAQGGGAPATVTVRFSQFNAPVTINEP